MAWRYTRQDVLISPDGRNWRAVSGPGGYGRIPSGQYRVGDAVTMEPGKNNGGYTDPDGFAWWCPLYSRSYAPHMQLGIHPDGNVPGSNACIGITESTSRHAYDELKSTMDRLLIVE